MSPRMNPAHMNTLRTKLAPASVALAVSALLTACVAGPNFVTPKSPAADRYTTEQLPNVALPANGSAAEVPELWWSLFQSPKLNETVQTALAGNRSLKASQATLKQAQELLGVAKANRMPEVTAEASNGPAKAGRRISRRLQPSAVHVLLGRCERQLHVRTRRRHDACGRTVRGTRRGSAARAECRASFADW